MTVYKKVGWLLIALIVITLILLMLYPDIPLDTLKKKYTNEASQFIDVAGQQVHYRDEGSGRPVLLLHGTGSSLHTWDKWTEVLAKEYRVIRMDLPAFGLTGLSSHRDYSIEAYSNFLDEFLIRLQIDSSYLIGNSLGGNIAWYFAAQHPEKVTKLILIDPSGYPTTGEVSWIFKLARTPVLGQLIARVTPRFVIESNLKQVYYDDSKVTEDLVTCYHDMALRQGNRQAFIDRAKTAFVDHTGMLPNITASTLILWGADDEWIPFRNAHKFKAAIKNAAVIVMDSTGHVPMEEQPFKSLQIAQKFLRED